MLDDMIWKAKHKLNKIFKVERCSLLNASAHQSSSINQEFTDILCDLSCGKAKISVYESEVKKGEKERNRSLQITLMFLQYHLPQQHTYI